MLSYHGFLMVKDRRATDSVGGGKSVLAAEDRAVDRHTLPGQTGWRDGFTFRRRRARGGVGVE